MRGQVQCKISGMDEGVSKMTAPRWEYVHSCGKPAFYAVRPIGFGERFSSKPIRHLDGSEMKFGEKTICDSCKQPIKRSQLLTCNFIKIEIES